VSIAISAGSVWWGFSIIELRTGKGTHSLSGILNIDAKRSIVNPRFNSANSRRRDWFSLASHRLIDVLSGILGEEGEV
jgi:hypothetical protein